MAVYVVMFQTLLSRCPRTDNILEVLDDSGWNILQRVIICNQPQVASMLLGTCNFVFYMYMGLHE